MIERVSTTKIILGRELLVTIQRTHYSPSTTNGQVIFLNFKRINYKIFNSLQRLSEIRKLQNPKNHSLIILSLRTNTFLRLSLFSYRYCNTQISILQKPQTSIASSA